MDRRPDIEVDDGQIVVKWAVEKAFTAAHTGVQCRGIDLFARRSRLFVKPLDTLSGPQVHLHRLDVDSGPRQRISRGVDAVVFGGNH